MNSEFLEYEPSIGNESFSISSSLMPSGIYSLLNKVNVEEEKNKITIKGIPAREVIRAIERNWGTSRIASNIFLDVSSSRMVFYSFYAVEIYHILTSIIEKRYMTPGHRSLLQKTIVELKEKTWLKNMEMVQPTKLHPEELTKLKKSPLETQEKLFTVYDQRTQQIGLNGYLLGAPPGSGKAQPLSAPVLTPNGWVTMGSFKLGDTVIAWDNSIAKITGIFPQGKRSVYNLTCADGRTAPADGEHLWRVYSPFTGMKNPMVIDTIDILTMLKENIEVYLDLPKPIVEEVKIYNDEITLWYFDDICQELPYNEKEKALIDQAKIRSLGGIARIYEKDDKFILDYEVNPDNKLILINNIEYSHEEECQCICIDHVDHLYITQDYIVTHNTLTSLMLNLQMRKKTIFIFCLKSTLYKPWEETLETELNYKPKIWTSRVNTDLPDDSYDFVICHYEAIAKILPAASKFKGKDIGIILDECHNMNDIKSDRTQNFVTFCQESKCSDVLFMSGTPLKAMTTELIPLLRVIDPLFTPPVEESFKKIFGVSTQRANDIVRKRLGVIQYKFDKTEVVSNEVSTLECKVTFPGSDKYTLPVLKDEMRKFIETQLKYYADNKAKYHKEYHDIVNEFSEKLKDKTDLDMYRKNVKIIMNTTDLSTIPDIIQHVNAYERRVIQPALSGATLKAFKNAKSIVKYVGLKVRGEALGRILGRRRAECHVDMIKHAKLETFVADARKKTLIFTSYVDVVKGLTDYFSSSEFSGNLAPEAVYQETSKNIANILKSYATNPKTNPLIATYDTLSTGVPVTEASTVILFNQPFRSYEREQAISRSDRKGQDGPVTVVDVLLDTGDVPNISTRSAEIMQWSKDQVESISGVKISETDNLSIGLEDFIEPEDLRNMSELQEQTKTLNEYHSDVLAVVDSAGKLSVSISLEDFDGILSDFGFEIFDKELGLEAIVSSQAEGFISKTIFYISKMIKKIIELLWNTIKTVGRWIKNEWRGIKKFSVALINEIRGRPTLSDIVFNHESIAFSVLSGIDNDGYAYDKFSKDIEASTKDLLDVYSGFVTNFTKDIADRAKNNTVHPGNVELSNITKVSKEFTIDLIKSASELRSTVFSDLDNDEKFTNVYTMHDDETHDIKVSLIKPLSVVRGLNSHVKMNAENKNQKIVVRSNEIEKFISKYVSYGDTLISTTDKSIHAIEMFIKDIEKSVRDIEAIKEPGSFVSKVKSAVFNKDIHVRARDYIGLLNQIAGSVKSLTSVIENQTITYKSVMTHIAKHVNPEDHGMEQINDNIDKKPIEHFSLEEFNNDVVPSLEGIFDSATNLVKKIFKSFSTMSIDEVRVEPFMPKGEFVKLLNVTDYSEFADMYVLRPEGLNVNYIHYTEAMAIQFNDMSVFFENALGPITRYLALLSSNPNEIGSVRQGSFNNYIVEYDLNKHKNEYAKLFKAGNTTTAYYHQMIQRNSDWQSLGLAIRNTQSKYLTISPEKTEERVNNAYEILEDIVTRLKTDEEFRKLSKVQIRDLSTLAYTLASVVEFYSILMFNWRVFNQSVRESETNL